MLDSSFCSVLGGASLLYLAASVYAQKNPPLCDFFNFPSFPIPVLALYFFLATWVQPSHPASPHLSSVSGANLVLTHRLFPSSRFPRRYASFGVMAVSTNGLTCGFNWQCTADAIGYAVMTTVRLDSLPSPYSLPRFGSTPAAKQPGRVEKTYSPPVFSRCCYYTVRPGG